MCRSPVASGFRCWNAEGPVGPGISCGTLTRRRALCALRRTMTKSAPP
jgi:hypothetical protein